jgi:DNA-binding response OmpR family regulator
LAADRCVILVDDDRTLIDMYQLGLELEGFRVIALPDAVNLNQVVEDEFADAVVLDWELPGIRGDEALERLRQAKRGRTLPVFMLSNFPRQRNSPTDRVFEFGAIAWLEKVNTTPPRLAERLRGVLVDPRPG